MKIAQKTMIRMKNILKNDKEKISLPLLSLIKSDFYSLINNYFAVDLENIKIEYFVSTDGRYQFELQFSSNRIKKLTFIN